MKKLLVAFVLATVVAAVAQATQPQGTMTPAQPAPPAQTAPAQQPAQPAPGQAAPAQPAQAAAPEQPCRPAPKKEIKDPAEYNAYTGALNAPTPQAKIQGFETFVQQFPNSAYKEEALEYLMNSYQQTGNAAKMIESAKQLLQVNPNNVRALALLAYVTRVNAGQSGNVQQAAAEARSYGEKGLQALQVMPCPEGVSPADLQKLKNQTSAIFHGAIGFAALQNKDYATAQQHFQAAVQSEGPTAAESLNDVYALALAYLEPKPPNPLGLWYIARAVSLSANNPQGQQAITQYGRAKYIKYHGGEDGWDVLLNQARSAQSNMPPPNFAVAPAPSPAEQAAKLANTVDPKKMDFGQWELVLSAGDPATQEKVWSQIKGIEVPFAARVIQSTKTELSLAATADAIEQNRADVVVTMTGPIPANLMPTVAAGKDVQVVAKPDSYTPNPFVLKMVGGQLIAKAAPKPAPKKGTTRKRTR